MTNPFVERGTRPTDAALAEVLGRTQRHWDAILDHVDKGVGGEGAGGAVEVDARGPVERVEVVHTLALVLAGKDEAQLTAWQVEDIIPIAFQHLRPHPQIIYVIKFRLFTKNAQHHLLTEKGDVKRDPNIDPCFVIF